MKSAKRIAKSILSIVTNITSGSEDEENKDKKMDKVFTKETDKTEMINSKQNMLHDMGRG